MGNAREPADGARDGDAVTTEVGAGTASDADLQAQLAEAEAEAAEAEAAAAVARAKARAMRLEQEGDSATAESDEDSEDTGQRRRFPRPSLPLVAKIIAAIVIVASLAGSGWIAWLHHQASAREQRTAEFVDTAKQGVVELTSIDFKTVRSQVQHIIDNSTGSFRDDFVARSDQFIKVSETSQVVAKGTVSAAAVEKTVSPDEAVVLVVGSSQITNAAGEKQPKGFRFRVTVTKDGDQMKVSKLEMVL